MNTACELEKQNILNEVTRHLAKKNTPQFQVDLVKAAVSYGFYWGESIGYKEGLKEGMNNHENLYANR